MDPSYVSAETGSKGEKRDAGLMESRKVRTETLRTGEESP